jgi:hypothetical protein
MVGFTKKFIILAGMLLGLPLLGVKLAGLPVARYLEFPPKTIYTIHASFSWIVWTGYAAAVFAVMIFLCLHCWKVRNELAAVHVRAVRPFPWWGWLGIVAGAISWLLAWSRFRWFAAWQLHTFTPLWLSFIVVINALAYRRRGKCMMTHQTKLFLSLFPASSTFWWFFEYLNRFVQNWYYLNGDFSPIQYFLLATLPFSTVLPAVLSVREWLLCYPYARLAFGDTICIRLSHSKALAWLVLAGSALGLTGIGIFPDYLFPLLWVSPLLIIVSLQTLGGEQTIFSEISNGDWSIITASALAALFCGFFWEMWNYYSLAKWKYSIPYVDRFHLFEMPLLGYAGYLPFGLECAVIASLLSRPLSESHDSMGHKTILDGHPTKNKDHLHGKSVSKKLS